MAATQPQEKPDMFTHYYNGMYINGSCTNDRCYVSDDTNHVNLPRLNA